MKIVVLILLLLEALQCSQCMALPSTLLSLSPKQEGQLEHTVAERAENPFNFEALSSIFTGDMSSIKEMCKSIKFGESSSSERKRSAQLGFPFKLPVDQSTMTQLCEQIDKFKPGAASGNKEEKRSIEVRSSSSGGGSPISFEALSSIFTGDMSSIKEMCKSIKFGESSSSERKRSAQLGFPFKLPVDQSTMTQLCEQIDKFKPGAASGNKEEKRSIEVRSSSSGGGSPISFEALSSIFTGDMSSIKEMCKSIKFGESSSSERKRSAQLGFPFKLPVDQSTMTQLCEQIDKFKPGAASGNKEEKRSIEVRSSSSGGGSPISFEALSSIFTGDMSSIKEMCKSIKFGESSSSERKRSAQLGFPFKLPVDQSTMTQLCEQIDKFKPGAASGNKEEKRSIEVRSSSSGGAACMI
ncbi:uncharacterized protein LOC126286663 [Schistocerca gregaria]|uniref:uncharacterized protein LOC126286663 n=1 Tax=Schistocerca gregaria TaxID=7010 RepID=UPI00211EAB53|nr:uncharacterized protein LOC126286663 [Schistocerca gregaria]